MSSPRPHFSRARAPANWTGASPAVGQPRDLEGPERRAAERKGQHRGFSRVLVGVEIAMYCAVAYALVSGPLWSMAALVIAIIVLSGLERRGWVCVS